MVEEYNRHEHNGRHLSRGRHLGGWQQHRRGILRTWVFAVLQQEPRNGYEIMNQIEFASPENWRPSPGSMYPLLDQLCKEESIRKREDGRYEITEKGKKEFEWPYEMLRDACKPCLGPQKPFAHSRQPNSAEAAIDKINSYISYLEDLKRIDPSKITENVDGLKNVRDRLTTLIDKM